MMLCSKNFLSVVLVLAASATASAQAAKFHEDYGFPKNSNDLQSINKIYDWHAALKEGFRRKEHKDYTGAEACFRQALSDAKKSKASTDDIVECMNTLADVLYVQDLEEEVLKLYKQSLRALERKYGKESSKLLVTLKPFANFYEFEGQYKHAQEMYARAAEILQKQNADKTIQYADFVHLVGRTAVKQYLSKPAEDSYKLALRVLMTQGNLPDDKMLNEVLADYIDVFRETEQQNRIHKSALQSELLKDRVAASGQTAGVASSEFSKAVSAKFADQAYQKALLAEGANPPSSSPNLSHGVLQLPSVAGLNADGTGIKPDRSPADAVALQEINKQRVDFYERMIAIDIESLGEEHPSVARDLTSLATIYLNQHDHEHAKPLLERALKIYRKTYGDDAQLVSRTETLLAYINDDKKSPVREARMQADYLSKLVPIPLQAQKLEIALRLNYLALLAYSFGQMDEAQEIYSWALSDTVRVFGSESVLAADCMLDYGTFLNHTGRQAEAAPIVQDAQDILRVNMERRALMALP